MKVYKVGDEVTIKSLDWYNENKDKSGTVPVSGSFVSDMSKHCGKTTVITEVLNTPDRYHVECDPEYWSWSAEMFEGNEKEETMKYKVGDKVKLKSQEWYDNHEKDSDGFIRSEIISFNPKMCEYLGRVATITACYDNSYDLDIDNGFWSWSDYMIECKVDEPDNWGEEDDEDDEESDYNMPTKGDWVMVADKYSEEGPREDWTIAKFVEARSKGIDTEEGIWNYCVVFDDFELHDWKETLKYIYKGEDRKLIKVNKDE